MPVSVLRALLLAPLCLSVTLACGSSSKSRSDATDAGDTEQTDSTDSTANETGTATGSASTDSNSQSDTSSEDPPIDTSCLELVPLRGWTTDPSAIAQLFSVQTCNDGTPIADLRLQDFSLTEDDQRISSEADPGIQPSTGLRVYVTLLLDLSNSTKPTLPELIDASENFVDQLLVDRGLEEVFIGIQLFDGGENLDEWQPPISDPARLKGRLRALEKYEPRDGSSTNLNGAAVKAVHSLQEHQAKVIAANDNGVVTVGYIVLFTDGADTAGRVSQSTARDVLAGARTISALAVDSAPETTVHTYGVALTGDDYTEGALDALLSGPPASYTYRCDNACRYAYDGECDDGGHASQTSECDLGSDCYDCGERQVADASSSGSQDASRYVFNADNAEALRQSFADLALAISRQLKGMYLLAYCSPKRSGTHRLSVNVGSSVTPQSRGFDFTFDASGFAGGCSAQFFETVCDNRECGGFNCGACNEESEVCVSSTGQCENACLSQNSCGGQSIVNGFGYPQLCDFSDLSIEQCGGGCVDVSSDRNHCGECNNTCPFQAACADGACECADAHHSACPAGCFDLNTDDENCGICGNFCPPGIACNDGNCDCGDGLLGCFGACVDTQTSQNHCGACGRQCSHDATCMDGQCVCTAEGLTSCAAECVDTQSDAQHCGACSKACAPEGEHCVSGACQCLPDLTDCDGECVDFATDANHCGGCGAPCAAGQSCTDGECTDDPIASCTNGELQGSQYTGILTASPMLTLCDGLVSHHHSVRWRVPAPGYYSFWTESLDEEPLPFEIHAGCPSGAALQCDEPYGYYETGELVFVVYGSGMLPFTLHVGQL